MLIISTTYGSRFEQVDKESILDSAENAGVSFPYSCRDGRCSSCKCKVLSGETACLSQELGLTDDQRLQGWILSCVRTAKTNITLEVEDLGGLPLIKPKTLPCKIDSITQISNDIIRVFLRLPPSIEVEYYAGQYVDLVVGNIRRSYSIANAPTKDNRLEFHIKKVERGLMSEYWFEKARMNDLLRIVGPHGTFFLRTVVGQDLVFLATGTGIAPVKAILESLNDKPKNERPNSVTVYWGGRTLDALYWRLSESQYPARYEPVLSRPSASWSGAVGYVQDAFLDMSPDLTKSVVYACGSDEMIRSARERLIERGFDERRFYSDAFIATGSV